MTSRVWRRIRIELAGPSWRKLAAPELLAVNGYPVPLGGQLVGEDDDQYFDLVGTPGALGVRNTTMMMLMMVELQLAAALLDVDDEKRGEGGAPHLG